MMYAIFWLVVVGVIVSASVGAYFLVKRLFTHERYYRPTERELDKVRKDIDKLKK